MYVCLHQLARIDCCMNKHLQLQPLQQLLSPPLSHLVSKFLSGHVLHDSSQTVYWKGQTLAILLCCTLSPFCPHFCLIFHKVILV